MVCGNPSGIEKLLGNADKWSYSHRVSNGELSDKAQQKLIDRAFWKLNEI
jgi:hypothetical protein